MSFVFFHSPIFHLTSRFKNQDSAMKRRFTLLFLSLCFFIGHNTYAQIGCPNINTLYPATIQNLVSSSVITITCANAGQYSRWQVCAGASFSWTTCGSNAFDSELTLIEEATGLELAYNDDNCANSESTIYFTPTFTGVVRLLVNEYPCASNTICTNVIGRRYTNCGSCPDANLFGTTNRNDSTCNRGNECIFSGSADLMYSIVIPCEADWTFSVCTSPGWDPEMHLGNSCCNADSNFSQDACGDGPVIFQHLIPGTYYITIEGYDSLDCGLFNLQVTGSSTPGNDSCSGAVSLGLNAPITGSTECSGPDVAITCGAQANNSSSGVWYKIVGNGNKYTASLCNNSFFDTRLRVFSGTCGSLVCVTGNDNFCSPYSQSTWCATNGVTYYILVDGSGTASGNFTIEVTETVLPSASFSGLNPVYCVSSPPSTLVPVFPGGVFTGNGISGTTFTPSPGNLGTNNIIYSIFSGGCAVTQTQVTVVTNSANASFSGLLANYCSSSPISTLTPVMNGGTFTGPGISGNNFNPALAGAGTHQIIYSINLGGACVDSDTISTTVNVSPNPAFSGLAPTYCVTAPSVTLVPTVPGGTFSGPGVSGTTFNPALAGIGSPTIRYVVTANGCSDSSSVTISVISGLDGAFTGLFSGYCTSDPAATLVPNTPGGTFSGPGVSGNTFTPSLAGVGTHTVSYTVSSGGCSGSSSMTVSVGTTPNAAFSGLPATACANGPSITLTPVTSGGVFSGPGTSGLSFSPSLSGAGTHTITYTANVGGCAATTSQSIIVNATPNASFSGLNAVYCNTAPAVTLIPVTSGGAFSGIGVSGNVFNPSVAGLGQHIVIYTVTVGGCTNTWNDTVNVQNALPATFTGLNATYCANDSPSVLVPTNSGGSFSSTSGTTGPLFSPALEGPGTYTITYTLNMNGCITTSNVTTTVLAVPAVSFTGLDTSYCNTSAPSVLIPTPTGGTFVGPGMSGSTFDPSIAGIGTHTIRYAWAFGGCTGTYGQQVTVIAGPNASFTGPASSYCQNSPAVTLVPATSGGTFTGPGVSGTTFTPSAAGPGLVQITYTLPGSCSATTTQSVTVNALPIVSLGPDTSICQGDTLLLNASNPGSTYAWTTPLGPRTTQMVQAYFPGTYIANVTSGAGCSKRDTLIMNFLSLPTAAFSMNLGGLPVVLFIDNSIGNPTGWAWTFGDGGTSAVQNPNHTYTSNGTYIVKLIVTGICGTDSFIDTLQVLNISLTSALNDESVNVYPNPNNGAFTVELNGNFENASISVTDLLGREVGNENNIKTKGKSTHNFNLSSLSKGTYLVRIQEGDGNIIRKVVVQ